MSAYAQHPGGPGPAIVRWLAEPRADRWMRFAADDGGWRSYGYDELASRARRACAQLLQRGFGTGDGLLLILPSGPQFVSWLFGGFASGMTVTPVAPLGYFQDFDAHVAHIRRIIELIAPTALIVSQDTGAVAARALEGLRDAPQSIDADDLGSTESPIASLRPGDTPLVQLTSGSSGSPRGVRISSGALEAQMDQIEAHVEQRPSDSVATWLPPHHDMGLIGCLVGPAMRGVSVSTLRPDQFLREPTRWLSCFDAGGATITACPTFGWGYAAKRLDPRELARLDLSQWRIAIVGAERVGPAPLQAFTKVAGPRGFRSMTYMSGYGLAEATLAVTLSPPEEELRAALIDWDRLRLGVPVVVREQGPLARASSSSDPAAWLVACGGPVAGASVWVRGEDGEELEEGRLGEIVVEGPNLASSYQAASSSSSSSLLDGQRLHSGDSGFLLDGELYVIGRTGDAISVRGRNVYMEDLDMRLARIEGVPFGRGVTFAGASGVVALVELAPGSWVGAVDGLLRRALGGAVTVTVLAAEPGTILRTSSGKPRRREMWQRFIEGRLGAQGSSQAGELGGPEPQPVAPTGSGST